MRAAIDRATELGLRDEDIVVASVFTTQSVTARLEQIRDQIKHSTPDPADFLLGVQGARTIFPLDHVTDITWYQQRTVGARLTAVAANLDLLRNRPGAIGRVAFGRYRSPDYLTHPGEFMPPHPTRTGSPPRVGSATDIYFNLYLPSGPIPARGWPVAIWGHGGGSSKDANTGPNLVAASLASHGIAVIAINAAGHGYGPTSLLSVSEAGRVPVLMPAGGRSVDQDGDGIIGPAEGRSAPPRRRMVDDRDSSQRLPTSCNSFE